jgi:regulator of replication initiation timing
MNTWSGIYRRDFLNEHNIRHNSTPGASFQDNGFWFQTFIYAKRGMILDVPYYMNRRDNPNSSVRSKEKVYCVNVEYDYIRNILQRDPEIWERFKGMYWFKKYHNYVGTIKRISQEYKREYVQRFSAEFKRGMEMNELDDTIFTANEWTAIQFLIKDPEGYYLSKVVASANEIKLQKEITTLNENIKKLNKFKKQSKILTEEVTALKDENAVLTKEKAALKKENAALKKKLKELEKKNTTSNNEVKKLKAENDKQKKEISALRKSASFRIGKFFTFIPGKIKRLFKK